MTELRIPVKPQRWLFVLNLFVQPPLIALFAWMAVGAEGTGERVFGGVMSAFALVLLGFSVLVLARTWGKTFEIVVEGDAITFPNPLRGTTDRVAFAGIKRATLQETRTTATSFWMLQIAHGEPEKGLVISSQMIGPDAFEQVKAVLTERGVAIR